MKNQIILISMLVCMFIFFQCSENKPAEDTEATAETSMKDQYHGFESQIAWGEHLVIVGGCNDCHTPKKMTPRGPVLDSSLWLSGHPAQMPRIDVNRKEMEKKGLVITMDLTEWVGPWGVSFSANLTPDDATGTGTWTKEQFMIALREGKAKGLPAARTLLPPMPWDLSYQFFTDDEIYAVFAYLQSIKPISNAVPAPIPPVSAPM